MQIQLMYQATTVNVKVGGKHYKIGEIGVLHPIVLKNYELPLPVSTFEINLEIFL